MNLAHDGVELVAAVLSRDACAAAAARVALGDPARGGTRCLLGQPWCADLARQLRSHAALAGMVPADAPAIACNYFEKSSDRNWLVPIHQDLSIPVAARVTAPALRGWSEKEGMLFVQAPPAVLAQMVALRLHLDDCGPDDGPLRVVPGSHLRGIICASEAVAARTAGQERVCTAQAGDVLAMRPLVLHASSKGTGGSRRRVLHMVFGPPVLPHGLQWALTV